MNVLDYVLIALRGALAVASLSKTIYDDQIIDGIIKLLEEYRSGRKTAEQVLALLRTLSPEGTS